MDPNLNEEVFVCCPRWTAARCCWSLSDSDLLRSGLPGYQLRSGLPMNPCGEGGQDEDGGNRASGEGGEVDGEPVPPSGCLLQAVVPPVTGDQPWHPPKVGEHVDADQHRPDQEAEQMHTVEHAL